MGVQHLVEFCEAWENLTSTLQRGHEWEVRALCTGMKTSVIPAASGKAIITGMDSAGRFRRRIPCVDSDPEFVLRWAAALRGGGYEVLTATDGFAALQVLRGAHPDLLVTELNLQRMSGFELLSVVRSRFPGIGVIAVSSEYTAVTVPDEVICDAFLSKGPNLDFELGGRSRAAHK
jgi:CheY-like chemotaxis protein